MGFFDFVNSYIFSGLILCICDKTGFVTGYSLIFPLFFWYTKSSVPAVQRKKAYKSIVRDYGKRSHEL